MYPSLHRVTCTVLWAYLRLPTPLPSHACTHDAALVPAVKVVFIDTLHLFPETTDFLREVEGRYSFKALVFTPKDFPTVQEYQAEHGVDLPIRDIEECAACAACAACVYKRQRPGIQPVLVIQSQTHSLIHGIALGTSSHTTALRATCACMYA